jgi:hypothetical protein
MLKFVTPIAQTAIGGLRLSFVQIHLDGPKPVLRAHFRHTDATGNLLPLQPLELSVTNDKNGNHFDALFAADGNADSLRTRIYKAMASKVAQSTIVTDPASTVVVALPDQPAPIIAPITKTETAAAAVEPAPPIVATPEKVEA